MATCRFGYRITAKRPDQLAKFRVQSLGSQPGEYAAKSLNSELTTSYTTPFDLLVTGHYVTAPASQVQANPPRSNFYVSVFTWLG